MNRISNTFTVDSAPPALLAWCSTFNNKIKILDLSTKQEHAEFDGAQLTKISNNYGFSILK